MKRIYTHEAATAFALFVVAAVVFTWPLAAHLTSEIPTGSRPATVALFGLFTMEWTGQALEQGLSYWNAPIFHPHAGTFAWSETQSVTSVVVWLISKVTGTVPAYNLVLLCYLALTGLAGYALARQLTEDRTAASWAGLWATAGAYPISQLTILHLLAGAFPIACIACLIALARRPSSWIGGTAALCYCLTLLTCTQFGLFLTMLLPLVLAPLVVGSGLTLRQCVTRFFAPLVAGLLPALPFLLTQRSRLELMGFERSLLDVRGAYSLGDLFLPARGHWLTGRLSEAPGAYPSDLGVVLLLCVTAAALFGGFRSVGGDPVLSRGRLAVLLTSLTALVLGFGPRLGVLYTGLREVVPGLDAVRTPARFGMFATVGLATLAAAGLAFLRSRAGSPARRRLLTVTAFVLLLAEMWAVPIGLVNPDREIDNHAEVLSWLGDHAEGDPLLELPMAPGDGEAALEREIWAMRRALVHGSPVVNGYSGYFPEPFRQLKEAVRDDLAGRARRYMAALGVRYVLVHQHDLEPVLHDFVRRALGGRVVLDTGQDLVILLEGSPSAQPLGLSETSRRFGRRPERGTVLGFPVTGSASRAQHVVAAPGQLLEISWPGGVGGVDTGRVRLRGSVLVDAGSVWVHVLVQRPPAGQRTGEAVLVPAERVPR